MHVQNNTKADVTKHWHRRVCMTYRKQCAAYAHTEVLLWLPQEVFSVLIWFLSPRK